MAESNTSSHGIGHHNSARNKKSNKIEIHRVNDFLLGHVGQVSYHSVHDGDADIGGLGFNRVIEQPPSFQELLPSEKWFASTRTKPEVPHADTFKKTKSQRNWLLKTHPEAFLGNVDLQGTISEQLRAPWSHYHGIQDQMGSALAVGEILDLRNASRATSRPAVAMAAGEAGQILRVSVVDLRKWTWAESLLPIGAMQSQFHGTWSSEGAPISKIRFAAKLRQYDPIRWLIAQRSSSTTIFQPEIRATAAASAGQTAILCEPDVQHIALNPLVTLTTDATGGVAHSDFSVNIGSESDAPQIAIIDRSGNWSVWFIDSQRVHLGKPRVHTAVQKSRGACGLLSSLLLPGRPHTSESHHRISWVRSTSRVDDRERDSSPSEASDAVSRLLQNDYLTSFVDSDPKYDALLICDNSCVQIMGLDGAKVLAYLNFSRQKGADELLDAQSIEGCPSHVLVLTTERLYVLDLSSDGDQEASKPNILVSCLHFKGQTNELLKMSVARLQSPHDRTSVLVLLHSSQNARVQLFYITISSLDGSASFHHRVVQCPGFHTSLDGQAGIASLHAVSLQLSASKSRSRSGSGAADAHKAGHELQLFQIFGLANDLSLVSSVVAITFGSAQKLVWLRKSKHAAWDDTHWKNSLRKRAFQKVEGAFIVPDEFEEDRQLRRERPTKIFPRRNTIQLRSYLIKLMEEINNGFFGESSIVSAEDNSVGAFSHIQEISENREADQHVALQPLLAFRDIWHSLDLAKSEAVWSHSLERLSRLNHVQLFQCGAFGPKLDVNDFFERFSINWSSQLAAESLTATQWRYMQLALERMAAEAYLSEKGIYMIPQSTRELASRAEPRKTNSQSTADDMYEDLPFSRSASDNTLPTPSETSASSRAASQVAESFETQEEEDTSEQEDPAVTRLRMYLPSIRFTPTAKQGRSRLMSLWPEQRGSDPNSYRYSPTAKGADGLSQAAKRRRGKEEDRRRRRAERRAHSGIKLESSGDSFNQQHVPDEIRSSPPPQLFAARSQGQHQGFGFGSQSQAQSQGQSFGPSQTMSQPLRGEFGTRPSMLRKKVKGKQKADAGTRKSGFK